MINKRKSNLKTQKWMFVLMNTNLKENPWAKFPLVSTRMVANTNLAEFFLTVWELFCCEPTVDEADDFPQTYLFEVVGDGRWSVISHCRQNLNSNSANILTRLAHICTSDCSFEKNNLLKMQLNPVLKMPSQKQSSLNCEHLHSFRRFVFRCFGTHPSSVLCLKNDI